MKKSIFVLKATGQEVTVATFEPPFNQTQIETLLTDNLVFLTANASGLELTSSEATAAEHKFETNKVTFIGNGVEMHNQVYDGVTFEHEKPFCLIKAPRENKVYICSREKLPLFVEVKVKEETEDKMGVSNIIEKQTVYKIKGFDGRRHDIFEISVDSLNIIGRQPMIRLVEEVEAFIKNVAVVREEDIETSLKDFISTNVNILKPITAVTIKNSINHLSKFKIQDMEIFVADTFNLIGFVEKGNCILMATFSSKQPIGSLFKLVSAMKDIK